MRSEQLIFGPPGCGKTYTLMQILKRELEGGTDPKKIGFFSFSRKAIAEAKERASSVLSLTDKDMPYFRTLHSMGFHWLGLKPEQVIGHYDLQKIGQTMGMAFDTRDLVSDDGVMQLSSKEGNKYLTMINRAEMRMVTLEQEYNDVGDHNIKWPLLQKLKNVYTSYKQESGKYDFTDMIKMMVERGQGPSLDVLIVDESQDLTPLQWEQVKVLRNNSKRVWYAGDDDQAIFRYTGVDVEHMLGICKDIIVLDQSYRVPRAVHGLASKLATRISKRQPKQWNPTSHEGSIQYHMSLDEINLNKGSWTIMARTTVQLYKVAEDLREQGILYTLNGRLSFNEETLKAMHSWQALQNGEFLSVQEAIDLYKKLPKQGKDAAVQRGMAKTLETVDPMKPMTYQDLVEEHGLLANLLTPAEDVLKLSKEEKQYLRAIKRRGEISAKPSVKLSTIHRMKGGEDDNIVIFTDMGYLPFKTLQENPDDEHRVFYTAVTRTKQNLHIIDTDSKYRYPL